MSPVLTQPPKQNSEIQRTFWIVLLSRLALNMQMRVIYPFLPAISRGLGASLETTSLLLTARAAANLSSPLYGALADRYGRRALMLAGLVILTTGTLFVALAPSFGAVLAAVAFLSLCKAVYDPAVLAYLGDRVPYERRGRIMGVLAMMWPLAWLVGVPLAAILIEHLSWRAPFVGIGMLGALSLYLTIRNRSIGTSPQCGERTQAALSHSNTQSLGRGIPLHGWMALLVTMLLILSSENVYIVYAAWLEKEFGLSLAALGVVSLVICLSEFLAEGVSAGWVDRIGKRRAVIGGMCVSIVAYLLLPRLAGSLVGALLGLFLVYLAYDFSIVSALPLLTELAPGARGQLMSLNVAAMAVGRLISSLVAVRLWAAGGLVANTGASAFAMLVALGILAALVRERNPEPIPVGVSS